MSESPIAESPIAMKNGHTPTVKTKVIKIGNSQGIRIPKVLLEQCQFQSEVELEVTNGHLTVRPISHPRQGWDEAFADMAKHGEDTLIDSEMVPTEWEQTEWEW